ncbi:hypothetical protein HZS_5464 [Henneguya salminicola]|nr:hypothetical protein HZS_5464 [Henneguya salminicola]
MDVTFSFLKIYGAKFKVNQICLLAIKLIANLHNSSNVFSTFFVPANDVIIDFNILSTIEFIISNFSYFSYFSYFEIISKILTLVKLATIQQEENHFFSIDLWNTYESTLAGLCRTNNNIDEGYNLHAVQKLNQGQTLRIQERKYRELHERILRILQSYNL